MSLFRCVGVLSILYALIRIVDFLGGVVVRVGDFLGDIVVRVGDFLGDIVIDVIGGVIVGVVGYLFVIGVVAVVVEVGERRRAQVPAHPRTPLPLPLAAPRSLRWVRGLLPGDEGMAWLAEVDSCLAETPDKGKRRRYVRSYRRRVPQLIWTSWTEHLRASRSRELS